VCRSLWLWLEGHFRPEALNLTACISFKLSALPASVGGRYTMDTRPIVFEDSFDVGSANSKSTLVLRSVVLTKYNEEFKVATGSGTIIITDPTNKSQYYYYDPNKINYKLDTGKLLENPIREIEYTHDTEENFKTLASTLGTVFIYECLESSN